MGKLILIVEDEPDASTALSEILRLAGYSVQTAETAKDAIGKAHDQQPDLLLIDIGLPDGSGLFLARMLGEVHATPMVIMTGRPAFSLEGDGLGANPRVKSVVFKPCSTRTLLRAVQEALNGQEVKT
jgi:DNA-binding response OmpR family regulator